jgi:hypothetical protein
VPDVYATIAEAEPAVVESLVEILELRAADPQQRAMREAYLAHVDFPPDAKVVEVGCGPGPVARSLASWPGVGGWSASIPPRSSSRRRASSRATCRGSPSSRATAARCRSRMARSTSSSSMRPSATSQELALAESTRVLREGGLLVVFDGDYATVTVACGDFDPLQACAEATVDYLVHDRWLVRRLPKLVREAGFEVVRFGSHSYVEAPSSEGYMLAIIDRGADALVATGKIAADAAEALKAEARRRSEVGEFYGHIAYASLIARKPA